MGRTNDDILRLLGEDVLEGAKSLLGALLVRGDRRARIVETEAYRAEDDPASHAFRGVTPRTEIMFGEPGRAYVYFSYGVHWMLNVVAHQSGRAGAVLIRAAVPLAGLETMRKLRRRKGNRELLSGPGKLGAAYELSAADNGTALFAPNSELRIEPGEPAREILAGPRVGIAVGKAHDYPWRFVDSDYLEFVSGFRGRPD